MSLINDALKRARQQQKQRPNPAPSGLPLQPVEERRGRSGAGPLIYPVLLVATLGLASWFFWQWSKASRAQPSIVANPNSRAASRDVTPPATAPATPTTVQAVTTPVPNPPRPTVQVSTTLVARTVAPKPTPAPTLPPMQASVPEPAQPAPAAAPPMATQVPVTPAAEAPRVVSTPAPVAQPTPPPPAPVAAPAAPAAAFPDLKLQAIFFRLNKPSVMINGKVVYTGESIDGAKVTRIERDHVQVSWNGETRPLHLR